MNMFYKKTTYFIILFIIQLFFSNLFAKESNMSETVNHTLPINSKNYWDSRFSTGDWINNNGAEQTTHFYNLLLNAIPDNIQEEMHLNNYTIMDFGCAQGEGTEFIANHLSQTKVTGIDFSCEAIKIANTKNKKAQFLCKDILQTTEINFRFDVVLSSNTLEHFTNPWEVLDRISKFASRYLIILIPFDEQNIPNGEHFYSFNYNNIPDKVGNFSLVFKKILYPDPRFWSGKQIILIYKTH